MAALTALLYTQQQAYEACQMEARNAISQAHNEISQARDQIRRLIEQIILARRRLFGPSSEQMSGQGRLFDEAEVLAEATTEAEDIAPLAPKSEGREKPARGKRGPLPAQIADRPKPDEPFSKPYRSEWLRNDVEADDRGWFKE